MKRELAANVLGALKASKVDAELALSFRNKEHHDLKDQGFHIDITMTVAQMIDDYLSITPNVNRSIAKQIKERLGSIPACQITRADVEDYLRWRQATAKIQPKRKNAPDQEAAKQEAKPVAPSAVNRHREMIRAAFNRAIHAGKLEKNPAVGIRRLVEDNKRDRVLTEKEFLSLVNCAADDAPGADLRTKY